MSDIHLNLEHSRYTELRRRLIEADPEIDETTLLDTLEGATNLNEALGEVIRAALEEETLADSLRDRMHPKDDPSRARRRGYPGKACPAGPVKWLRHLSSPCG